MSHLEPFKVHVYPIGEPYFQVQRMHKRDAYAEARKYILQTDFVSISDPDGKVIYRHSRPYLKRMRVLEAVR